MDDIFDKIREGVKWGADNVKKGADYVADKGGQFVELTKLRSARAKLEDELEFNYSELGKELYGMILDGDIVSSVLKERCAKIDGLKKRIDELLLQERSFDGSKAKTE